MGPFRPALEPYGSERLERVAPRVGVAAFQHGRERRGDVGPEVRVGLGRVLVAPPPLPPW